MTAFAILLLLAVSSVSWTGTDALFKLQNESRPLSYVLHLEPNITENKFSGEVIIDFTMMITTKLLIFNQKSLMIDTVTIDGVPIRIWHTNNFRETLIISCASALVDGRIYRIRIKYNGTLNENAMGFYKSNYTIGKETRWIAQTYFEPTGARSVFPCWDEPIYKAEFNISIRHLSNYTAVISNMPIVAKTYHADGTITTYFNRSIPMSTYLVAFHVSDYAFKSYGDHRFKIFTKLDSVHKTELAYYTSVEAMKVMDEYTEIPYFNINPKMDQMTSRHILSEAVQNLGILTYRDYYLLYEKGVSTSMDKEIVITTVSHVFANQWFGNLVSPKWWHYVWLSKGFSTYFQYFIAHKMKPTWRFRDAFPVKSMQGGAFRFECSNVTGPMNVFADDPQENKRLFNQVADDRGACIIRMLSHVLTEEVFHTAVKNYLHENLYSVADSDNLIKHLQDTAGQNKTWGGVPLTEIVQTWVNQTGYPMVTVRKISPGHYTLNQTHFLSFVPKYYLNCKHQTWWIPITYTTNRELNFTDTSVTYWMKPNDTNVTVLEPGTDWILLNKQQTGYYRVNYDEEIWQKLTEYLRSSNMHRIHPVNRAQLIDDALAMAEVNSTKYETALSLTLYLNREIDYIPWMTAFTNIAILLPNLLPTSQFDIFKHYIKYILHSVTKNVRYVGSSEDDFPTKLIRGKAMELACLANVRECVDEAHKEFNAWLRNPKYRLDPDLKPTILCTGLRNAGEEVWEKVLNKLTKETFDSDRKTNPLKGLGCSTNRTILQKFLMYAVGTDRKIRLEHAVKAVLANAYVKGMQIVQNILDKEIEEIKKMDNYKSEIDAVSECISIYVKKEDDFMWLANFVTLARASEMTMHTILVNSMININRMGRFEPIFDKWLIQNEKLFKSSGSEKTFMPLLLICSIFNTILFKMFL